MRKVYIKTIDCCNACPNLGADINGTRYECHNDFVNMFLTWMGNNDDNIPIPDWCTLPDELLSVDDMQI